MLNLPSTPQGLTKARGDLLYQPLGSYAPALHTHDDRYYTESEVTTLIAGLSGVYATLVHTHAAADVTSGVLDNARVNWGAPGAIGSVTPNTIAGSSLSIAPDTAVVTTLGRVRVGDISGGDIGYFAHYDFFDANSYAVYQNSSGNTRINAPSGQVVSLRIANTSVLSVTGSSILGNQSLSVLADTDATTILGRARIHSAVSDFAYFSHYDLTTATNYGLRISAAGGTQLNAVTGQVIGFAIDNAGKASMSSTGFRIGDGNTPTLSGLHVVVPDAVTNAITNVLTLGHNSSGTPAASFGTGLLFQGESTTTENRDMALIAVDWTTATDASRASRLRISSVQNATTFSLLDLEYITVAEAGISRLGTRLLMPSGGISGSAAAVTLFANAANREIHIGNLNPNTTVIPTVPIRIGSIFNAALQGGNAGYRVVVERHLELNNYLAASIALAVKGASAQSANLQEWQDNSSNPVAAVSPAGKFDSYTDTLRLRTAKTPASAAAAGDAGDICWDANYVYICTATNTWRRVAHATW